MMATDSRWFKSLVRLLLFLHQLGQNWRPLLAINWAVSFTMSKSKAEIGGGGAWWTQNQEGALWAWWSLVVHLNLQIMIHGSWTRNQGVLLALLTTAWFDLFLIVVLLFLSQYGIVVLLMDLLLEYYKGSLLIRSQCIDKREPLCLLLFGYQLFHLVSHKVVISRMFNFCCYLFIYCHLGRWFIKHT